MTRIALALLAVALLATACGSRRSSAPTTTRATTTGGVLGRHAFHCPPGAAQSVGSTRIAYAGFARHGAVAHRRPGGPVLARFGPTNVNGYPTVFGVVGMTLRADCSPAWYRVELPVKPNGAVGYVRSASLELARVRTRIAVSIARRRLTLYRDGRPFLRATVAVGSPATPTPTGRFYVNQRLVPDDPSGPYGPEAIGVSAFSNVLTGWTQGGPVAIHGTNEPWSIGRNVSNGCIRLRNAILQKVFPLAVAGTPVIISP